MINKNYKKEKISIVSQLIKNQNNFSRKPSEIRSGDRVGFAISTKDRVDFTIKSLDSIDAESGFDIIWVDGSTSEDGKSLPKNYKFRNIKLAEYHLGVGGGPDAAIKYGLKRLLDLGYDYCGLLENDIILKPGWFKILSNLFNLAGSDGIIAGAVTIRNFDTRVMEYRKGYTLNWNIGAGMILFTREAAQLVLDNYDSLSITGLGMRRFWGKLFGIDIKGNKEILKNRLDYFLSLDFSYDRILYKNGLSSVGSIPSLVSDLEFNITDYGLDYVDEDKFDTGPVYPKISKTSLFFLLIKEPILNFFCNIWLRIKKVKWIYKKVKNIEKKYFKKRDNIKLFIKD